MRKVSLAGAVAALIPAVALAHETGTPHLHPHGIGVVLAGMAIIFAGWYMYKTEADRQLAKDKSRDQFRK